MKPGFAITLSTMRGLCRLIAEQLTLEHGEALAQNPRLLFFPKRVHELGFHEGPAPSGLSTSYVEMAADLNKAVWKQNTNQTALATLLRVVEQTVCEATVNERRLTAILDEVHEDRSR